MVVTVKMWIYFIGSINTIGAFGLKECISIETKMLIFKVACMHFMQWMECAMCYEISVFDNTCFQSTICMLQMYAVGWNMPCTALLNSHTCF